MNETTRKKGAMYLILNFIDAAITDFILKAGGGELNPVFNILMNKGYTIFEIKLLILVPLISIWMVILDQNPATALKLLNIGLFVMKTLIAIEIAGIIFIYV
jgi:hypothetical protein